MHAAGQRTLWCWMLSLMHLLWWKRLLNSDATTFMGHIWSAQQQCYQVDRKFFFQILEVHQAIAVSQKFSFAYVFFFKCVMESICAQCPSGYCCIHTSWTLLLIWSLHLLNSSCQNLFHHPLLICPDGDGSNCRYAHAETFIAQNWSTGSSGFWRPHVTSNKAKI